MSHHDEILRRRHRAGLCRDDVAAADGADHERIEGDRVAPGSQYRGQVVGHQRLAGRARVPRGDRARRAAVVERRGAADFLDRLEDGVLADAREEERLVGGVLVGSILVGGILVAGTRHRPDPAHVVPAGRRRVQLQALAAEVERLEVGQAIARHLDHPGAVHGQVHVPDAGQGRGRQRQLALMPLRLHQEPLAVGVRRRERRAEAVPRAGRHAVGDEQAAGQFPGQDRQVGAGGADIGGFRARQERQAGPLRRGGEQERGQKHRQGRQGRGAGGNMEGHGNPLGSATAQDWRRTHLVCHLA